MRIRSSIVLMMLFTSFLMPAAGDDLRHQITDQSSKASLLFNELVEAGKTVWDEGVGPAFRQAQNAVDSGAISRAFQDVGNALTYIGRAVTRALGMAREILMRIPFSHTDLTQYINLVDKYWRVIAGLVLAIAVLLLFKAILPAMSAGPDWSRYTSEKDIKTKCIEPLLKDWKFSYVSERPCKIRMGRETLEGKIDFYLYDGEGAITIIEDKNTISGEEDLKNARVQARSYCTGLYVFEDIVVNSFVIASREGLWIYQIKHNVDIPVERVSPKNLKGSKKRQIKDKLLEIR
jgi:hypothetical protein